MSIFMCLRAVLAVVVGVLLAAPAGAHAALEAKPFGITGFSMQTTERTEMVQEKGGVRFVNVPYTFTQAGGHPWALTSTLSFATENVLVEERQLPVPTREPKDVVVDLPPGLLGDPVAVPRCSLTLVTGSSGAQCPTDTQIGVGVLRWFDGKEKLAPIVNVTPAVGQSAEFAIEVGTSLYTPLLTAHLIRTGNGEYGFDVASNEIPTGISLTQVELTFWGVPGDPSHNAMRGLSCGNVLAGTGMACTEGGNEEFGTTVTPFLTLPTDCSAGPETATVRADAWQEPGSVVEGHYSPQWRMLATSMPGVTGCGVLRFDPEIETRTDTLRADEPVALGVDVKVPQPELPGVDATPHLRDAVVTLPEGMSISPGIADGIQACEATGPHGINILGPEAEEVNSLTGELQLAPGHCPDASVIGSAEAITPLLPEPVKGNVYLARPSCGGPGERACTEEDVLDGNLYKLYLELGGVGKLANTGIEIKVEGKVQANPATGQLTTKFLDNPQTPFSELKIDLNGGPRSALDNAVFCSPMMTIADFTPWSAPGVTPQGVSMPGTPDATPFSEFDVDLAGDGLATPCRRLPFEPGFVAGTATTNAGQFSAFTMNLARQDREQYVRSIQLHTPPGLLAMLSSVPLCAEAQANTGSCSEMSRIGTTRVASGAGSHPFEIEGDVYLSGPYRGGPFGLSIVTHVVAGPFNLGLNVVRARIDIDRHDSTATVTTDETGPYAIPQIIFGVPVRLKRVTVNIDRPGFMFNPTNCRALRITASVSGSQQALATVSSPFAAGGCRGLVFRPTFKVSTSGKTSRKRGASLDVRLTFPKDAIGNDANVAKVMVSLPKQLPSYLSTLQKACSAGTFEQNPSACSKDSIVGIARTKTPVLPVGLEGPVYFVSHGGARFPSLIVVLQGDGVRVDLEGETFISKGITSSTFNTVPDVPVDSFELYLPQGKDHALAANGNLCRNRNKLIIPTTFWAQNGKISRQRTKIAVTDCSTHNAPQAHGRRGG